MSSGFRRAGSRRVLTVVATAGLVVPIGAGATASASAGGAAKVPTQKTFAGYELSKPKAGVWTASASFVIPSITCKKHESGIGPAVIVDTMPNKKNIYLTDIAAVAVSCVNNQPKYVTINQVENNYDNKYTNLQAGDTVDLSITASKKTTKVTVDDVTQKESETRTGKPDPGENASIGAAGLEINKHSVGIDPFGTLTIKDALINGKTLKAEKAVQYDLKFKTTLVDSSKLHHGDDFTDTFVH